MRYIVFFSALLGLALLYLLSLASANATVVGNYYKILLYLNIALATMLVVLIAFQIYSLYKSIQNRVVGSRLNLRMVSTFAMMAIIPGLIVYLVSVNFLSRSIESWFNVKVEAALDGGLRLGQRALDALLDDMKNQAESMATTLSLQPALSQYRVLHELRERTGVQDATLLSPGGRIMAVSSEDASSFLPDLPSVTQLGQAQYQLFGKAEPIPGKGLYLRVLAPVHSPELTSDTLILQLLQPVPESLSNAAEAVQDVYRDYQELSYSRESIKDVFKLTLTLVLMLAMLSALAIAFVLSRRLSRPLTILAEGTRAIADGDYSKMLPEHGNDELGVLVKSFNSMTRQLGEANKVNERNHQRLEAARAYLETTLAHLSSGVLAINRNSELRTFNLAAKDILGFNLAQYENQKLSKMANENTFLAGFFKMIETHFELTVDEEQASVEMHRQLEVLGPSGKQLLSVRATRLPASANSGFVVVFDDVTTMAQAQRDAAWGEVARRLAHEIKNPLTPIQLSAERVQHKLSDKLSAEDARMLTRATNTIVSQVGALKSMVNEFSEYARAPSASMKKVNLNQLILDVSGLYEGSHVDITYDLAEFMPDILGDSTMLRQVLHNLMQNAQDALEGQAEGGQVKPEITVKTSSDNNTVVLVVRDNGQGFPEQILAHPYEPYVTTKTKGTGLGLAIVKKMVEEHWGEVVISNNESGGACISIQLPLQEGMTELRARRSES
ncbi:MAG: ATP-binding protein [Methylophilaceae bacterium]